MAFVHGKSTVFKLDDYLGTLQPISAYLDSVSFPKSIETADVTAFGATNKSYIVGLQDMGLSISGKWDSAFDVFITGGAEPASRSFEYGPQGSTGGQIKYLGECIVTSYDISSGVGDAVSFSLQLQATGVITRTTW